MTQTKRRALTPAALLTIATFTIAGCLPPGIRSAGSDGQDGAPDTGTLLLTLDDLLAPSADPTIDMTAVSHVITGRGPQGTDFVRSAQGTTAEIQSLKTGVWDVTVEAANASGDVVGKGTTQVTVTSATSAAAAVKVRPVSGYGALRVTLSWPAAQVAAPSIDAQLVPQSGTAKSLSFTLGSGVSSSTIAKIPAGAATLTLRLLDGGAVVAGAIEVVQIQKNATTSVEVAFTDVDAAAPSVQTNITPQPDVPLAVNLFGHLATVAQGTGFTVTASVEGVTGNLVYAWYLNGIFRHIGGALSVPADLPPGSHRLDVTAFTADGLRAGTTGVSFAVTATVPSTSVTLAWDPSTGADVAGYKVHYGTTSGTYDRVVDAGNVTTFTVTGLQPGITHYFAATAYSSAGMESGYSNEVSH